MKVVMSIRFPVDQHQKIIEAAEQHTAGNPADLVRQAVAQYLENLDGGGLEARLTARLEAVAAQLPVAMADEIETRARARKAARQQQEGSQ